VNDSIRTARMMRMIFFMIRGFYPCRFQGVNMMFSHWFSPSRGSLTRAVSSDVCKRPTLWSVHWAPSGILLLKPPMPRLGFIVRRIAG
jgi:hypothetical protein